MYKKLLFIILPFLLFSCSSNVNEAEVKKARQFFESVFQDSVLVEHDVEWINPLSVKVFPKVNWIPDKDYIINIPQESIVPFYRKILKDSVYTISLKTSSYQKYGSLVINPGIDQSNNLKVELKMLGNEGVVLKNKYPLKLKYI